MIIEYVDIPEPEPEPEPYKLALPQRRPQAGTTPKAKRMEAKTTKPRVITNEPTFTVSADLSPIVGGHGHITRREVTNKVWAYIKANSLQDVRDGRMITPDTTLARVLGDKPIHMMKLQGILSKHLIKDTGGGPLDAGTNG